MSFPKFFSCALLSAASLLLAGCPSGDDTKKAVGTATQKTVGAAKGALSGIAEGIEEGRKETTGLDGAKVVSKYAEMEGIIGLEILAVADNESGRATLTLGFANSAEHPVRITFPNPSSDIMLLDHDGYVTRLSHGPLEVTIPAKAKDKAEFSFEMPAAKAANLRFLGQDIPLKPASAQ